MRSADIEPTDEQQKTITRILEVAEKLFRHYGCGKTTVTDIASDLDMSAANIYRFFASKSEIQQAICHRQLDGIHATALNTAKMLSSAAERLRCYSLDLHRMTIETMAVEEKVHEMVIVAIERDWNVIDKHIERMNEVVAAMISDGIAAGEFRAQDPTVASRCFNAAIVSLYHPQLVGHCTAKPTHARPEDLVGFAIRALS